MNRFHLQAALILLTCILPAATKAADTACGTPQGFGTDTFADGDMTRSLGCEAYSSSPRALRLCCGLERDLEWSWWGHATVSPGWRIGWDGVRDVYCREHVGSADLDALTTLSRGAKSQLQNGAEFLLHLLKGDPEPTSIFNPQNPQYVLREGCR